MSTELTHAIIENAKSTVATYKTNADAQYAALQTEIKNLRAQNFIGDASSGYQVFFDSKVVPALDENVNSLVNSINNILESIKTQLLDTIDPQMGQENQNPGTSS